MPRGRKKQRLTPLLPPAEVEALVQAHYRLAISLAGKCYHRYSDAGAVYDDVTSLALDALWAAAQQHDGRATKLFLVRRVRWKLQDYVTKLCRRRASMPVVVLASTYRQPGGGNAPFLDVYAADDSQARWRSSDEFLDDIAGVLTGEQMQLVRALFVDGHSVKECAALLSLPRQTVHNRRAKILATLRGRLTCHSP